MDSVSVGESRAALTESQEADQCKSEKKLRGVNTVFMSKIGIKEEGEMRLTEREVAL